jgi:hypothetical protein
MRIEEIASIIESSMRKIAEDDCCECNECCDDDNKTRELIVEAVGHFIDSELHEIERLIFEIGEERFGSEEELEDEEEKPDLSLYYQKIDEIGVFLIFSGSSPVVRNSEILSKLIRCFPHFRTANPLIFKFFMQTSYFSQNYSIAVTMKFSFPLNFRFTIYLSILKSRSH